MNLSRKLGDSLREIYYISTTCGYTNTMCSDMNTIHKYVTQKGSRSRLPIQVHNQTTLVKRGVDLGVSIDFGMFLCILGLLSQRRIHLGGLNPKNHLNTIIITYSEQRDHFQTAYYF